MNKIPYEAPRITNLSQERVFSSPDTSISREGLRAQAKKQEVPAKATPRPDIKAIKTLGQLFTGAENIKRIDHLRPMNEGLNSIQNLN